MPELSNPKEEMFCRYIVQGMTQIKAFTKAGYSHNPGNASTKNAEDHIQARIAELQSERKWDAADEEAAIKQFEAGDLTETWVITELMHVAARAKASGQYAPSKGALELIGEYLGMWGGKRKPKETEGIPNEIKKKREKIDLANFAARLNETVKQEEQEENADNSSTETDAESTSES